MDAGIGGNAGALVGTDTPCRKCSYNLRSLPVAGKCPECGFPVGAAVFGDLLKFSLPRWLRGLARGARLVYRGCTLVIFGACLMFFFAMAFMGSTMVLKSPSMVLFLLPSVFLLLIFGGGIMCVVGWWLLTQRDPSGLGEDRYGTSRRIIRVTLLIWIADLCISPLSWAAKIPVAVHQALVGIDIAAALVFAIGLGAQLRYIEKLAERFPDPHFGMRARIIKNSFPICYFLTVGWQKYMAFSAVAAGPPSNYGIIFGCTGGIASLGALMCLISYTRLLGRVGDRLKKEREISELIWDPDILPSILPK